MLNYQHRGVRAPGPGAQPVDRRVGELDEALRAVEAVTNLPGLGFMRDAARAAQGAQNATGRPGRFIKGTVIHALPYVNWYKVQTGGPGGSIPACLLGAGTLAPVGPRDLTMVAPNDDVLVFCPPGINFGIIVGAIPVPVADGSLLCPDWISQGGGTGLKREEGHAFPIKNMDQAGGVIDWSAGRPLDQTGFERGWIASTGLAVTIDDFMVQVRVSEQCGLTMTYYDGWCRLAGEQLLVESLAHEEDAGDDEGEGRYFRGIATYTHEALGQYAPGVPWTAQTDAHAVQYTAATGAVDLANPDLQPAYRYQEYGGYLGQGYTRMVVRPAGIVASGAGVRRFGDDADDDGLFRESIGLDGSYTLLSAKSVHIGKRVNIVAPRRKAPADSPKGDDATARNYMSASLFGAGVNVDHRVGDVAVTGEVLSILKAAAALDLVSYDVDWKGLHPFHYHANDYRTRQERTGGAFSQTQEAVAFGGSMYTADPQPVRLRIDHRYGDVAYFQRESFLRFYDDGTVHLVAGAGEEIVLGGGRVRINAPNGIDLEAGDTLSVRAGQVVVAAKGSIDLATDGDLRLKADGNLQALAGNSGEGGLLLESKGTGTTQDYHNKFGEDVRGSGVVVRAANGVCALLAESIYLRTGGDLGEGDITLDASRGKQQVTVTAGDFHVFTANPVTFAFGPVDETSTVSSTYSFGPNEAVMEGELYLAGRLIGYGDSAGIIVNGGISGTGPFVTTATMADRTGGSIGKAPPGFEATVTRAAAAAQASVDAVRKTEKARYETDLITGYYRADGVGADTVLADLHFSFRDPPTSDQYGVTGFVWPEARWQQLARLGLGSGAEPWTVSSVSYQGRQTYPYPGKRKWVDEPTYLRLILPTMFDPTTGCAADRPGPYLDPKTGDFEAVAADGAYTLTRM